MLTLFQGAVLAVATIVISSFIPEQLFYPFFALLLAFAAGAYLGFATVDKAHKNEYFLQIGFALVFLTMAFLGIWLFPLLIAFGWAMHGIWDLLHHLRQLQTETSKSYPLLCLSYDFTVAWFIFYYWVMFSP
jgi:hypothetical protein